MMFDEKQEPELSKVETSIVEEIKMNDYVEANKIVDNFQTGHNSEFRESNVSISKGYSNQFTNEGKSGIAYSNKVDHNNDWFSRDIEKTGQNDTMEHDNTAQMIADQINLSPSRKDEYQDLPES